MAFNKKFMKLALLTALAVLVFVPGVRAAKKEVLRVGVAPTSMPFQYWELNRLAGLEVDFAEKLGEELGLKVEVVDFKFRDLIPKLLGGEIDIIMSGMSVTRIRSMQVAFAEPYLKIGQMPLVRVEDQDKFKTPMDIISTDRAVGARENTTSEYLIVQEFPKAKKKLFPDHTMAVRALKSKKIDLLIMDSSYVFWQAMQNEGKLAPVPIYLTDESLAWALRKDDTEILRKINEILAKWKETGQLDAMIEKRIPGLK